MHTTIRPNYRFLFHFYFFSARPFDQKLGSSLIYIFHLHTTIRQKYMTFLSFILFLCTTIRPKISVLINFFLYMTIRPKLGVTLIFKFIIFLIEPIFCLQYCLYILSTTIIPLYFVYYIHRSAALIFRTLYPWLYEVCAFSQIIFFHGYWRLTGQQRNGGDHLLFHSTTSIHSQTIRHLFATLHVRWLSDIFNPAPLVSTKLLLDEIYHLIELPFDWLMMRR